MKKVGKSFRYGEKGFTLIELLIVVAILGILAAVVLPNVGGFLRTGNLAAANSEVSAVKTAAAADYAEDGTWDATSATLRAEGYLDREPEAVYTFDADGQITASAPADWGHGFVFNTTNQTWELP